MKPKASANARMRNAKESAGVRAKAITCGTAVGAKQGRAKGNKQKAEYLKSEETARETRQEGRRKDRRNERT